MIKAVIFDFGSVLVKAEPLYKKIAKKLKISEKKAHEIIFPLTKKWSCGKINEKEFWQSSEKRLKINIPPELKKDLLFGREEYIKGSWKILHELHKNKIRLALLSNIIPPFARINYRLGKYKKLKKLGFEAIVLSCKVGFRKPDPKIYKIVLKKLKLPANKCLFIDDKSENVRAARKLGMKGIRFKTPAKLRKDLSKIWSKEF